MHQKVDDFELTVFDLKTAKSTRKFAPYREAIRIEYGSIYDEQDLAKVTEGQDVVIHLAAIIPPLADEKPELTYQVNTVGTEKLIKSLEGNSPMLFSSIVHLFQSMEID